MMNIINNHKHKARNHVRLINQGFLSEWLISGHGECGH